MRQTIREQAALPAAWVEHPQGRELRRINEILDSSRGRVGLP